MKKHDLIYEIRYKKSNTIKNLKLLRELMFNELKTKTMANLFDFSNVKESTIIKPGIHEVVITKLELKDSRFKEDVQVLAIEFKLVNGTETYTEEFDLSMTPSPIKDRTWYDLSQERIYQIGKSVMPAEEFKKLKTLEQLSANLVGKQLRMKFTGKEVEKDDKRFIVTTLPFFAFTEPITIPRENTRLTFDKDDPYDIRRLPDNTVETNKVKEDIIPETNNNSDVDDLPF
jgi:hypothetical protein